MAYDPITGEYKPDDTSVSKRMTGLLSKNDPYMQQATTTGKKAANRRGLLNSTMAVTAVEDSRIRAALPIASQEAGQAHQRNLQGRDIQYRDISDQRNIGAQREFLGTEIASRERMQDRDIGSREGMQLADLAAAKERLGMSLSQEEKLALANISSREGMQAADIEAARERLSMELGNRASLQQAELAAAKERLGMQLSQQDSLALEELRAAEERLGIEISSRQAMQARDIELQERLAQMNLGANDRNAAAQIAQAFEASYSNIIAGIMANPDIPAAERQRYLNHAARVRDSNLNLVEQFYGIELNWGSPVGGSNTAPALQTDTLPNQYTLPNPSLRDTYQQ